MATLHQVSFNLSAGEVLGVLGASGSGKSTLARVLVGVWPTLAGTVRLDGADIHRWDRDDLGPHIGYLPQDSHERIHRIKELESLALKTGQTQLFIETPYRNAALWQALVQTLQPHTRLALASGLTLPDARIRSQLVRQWRQQPTPPDNRTPVVFAMGR